MDLKEMLNAPYHSHLLVRQTHKQQLQTPANADNQAGDRQAHIANQIQKQVGTQMQQMRRSDSQNHRSSTLGQTTAQQHSKFELQRRDQAMQAQQAGLMDLQQRRQMGPQDQASVAQAQVQAFDTLMRKATLNYGGHLNMISPQERQIMISQVQARAQHLAWPRIQRRRQQQAARLLQQQQMEQQMASTQTVMQAQKQVAQLLQQHAEPESKRVAVLHGNTVNSPRDQTRSDITSALPPAPNIIEDWYKSLRPSFSTPVPYSNPSMLGHTNNAGLERTNSPPTVPSVAQRQGHIIHEPHSMPRAQSRVKKKRGPKDRTIHYTLSEDLSGDAGKHKKLAILKRRAPFEGARNPQRIV